PPTEALRVHYEWSPDNASWSLTHCRIAASAHDTLRDPVSGIPTGAPSDTPSVTGAGGPAGTASGTCAGGSTGTARIDGTGGAGGVAGAASYAPSGTRRHLDGGGGGGTIRAGWPDGQSPQSPAGLDLMLRGDAAAAVARWFRDVGVVGLEGVGEEGGGEEREG